jgi:DNA-binding PadR family transcriptional regulator
MARYDVSCCAMAESPVRRDPAAFLPLTPALFHVLLSLADGQKHGYAILKDVADRTDGGVELSTGTLYGIIKRLLNDGLIRESASGSTDRRRAYRLTALGQRVASAEVARMRELVEAAAATRLLGAAAVG